MRTVDVRIQPSRVVKFGSTLLGVIAAIAFSVASLFYMGVETREAPIQTSIQTPNANSFMNVAHHSLNENMGSPYLGLKPNVEIRSGKLFYQFPPIIIKAAPKG